jgi:ferredoxin-NADP reductase
MRILLDGAGSHLNCAAELSVNGETELVSRPYTPYVYPAQWEKAARAEAKSETEDEGKREGGGERDGNSRGESNTCAATFEVVVKRYDGGLMSTHLCALALGDTVSMSGPIGGTHDLIQPAPAPSLSTTSLRKSLTYANSHIGMVAGGTGITPMLQVVYAIVHELQLGLDIVHADGSRNACINTARGDLMVAERMPKISIVFANRTEEEVICRADVDELCRKYPSRINCVYTMSETSGHVSKELLEEHMPLLKVRPPTRVKGGDVMELAAAIEEVDEDDDSRDVEKCKFGGEVQEHEGYVEGPIEGSVLYCGPPGFMGAVLSHLQSIGYSAAQIHGFA